MKPVDWNNKQKILIQYLFQTIQMSQLSVRVIPLLWTARSDLMDILFSIIRIIVLPYPRKKNVKILIYYLGQDLLVQHGQLPKVLPLSLRGKRFASAVLSQIQY